MCVCLFVGHKGELCKIGCTDLDVILERLALAEGTFVSDVGPDSTTERGYLRGTCALMM